jgi:hypothetical protein
VTWIVGAGSGGGPNNGDGAIRCAYVGTNAILSGFTLTNGHTRTSGDAFREQSGGGVWCEMSGVLTNCTLSGNSATYGGGSHGGTLNNCMLTGNLATDGGGASSNTLNNCTVTANSATHWGGGSYYGALNNCTVTGNSATSRGGGSYYGTLNNCIVYYNTASTGPNYYIGSFIYSCSTPQPSGAGNISAEPLFVNRSGGDLRLLPNSPCIDAGNDSIVQPAWLDLDGNPRIMGAHVDMGAYEFQSDTLLAFYNWLQSYGLAADLSAISADPDQDGMNNWQEWLAGTNPTNAASVLRLQRPLFVPGSVTLTWSSVTNRAYFVERATNLALLPAFSLLQTNIQGLLDTTSFTDTNPPISGPAFYRVGVQP